MGWPWRLQFDLAGARDSEPLQPEAPAGGAVDLRPPTGPSRGAAGESGREICEACGSDLWDLSPGGEVELSRQPRRGSAEGESKGVRRKGEE